MSDARRPVRVLFCTSNWSAHWFPMVALAWGLQAAGHDVLVLCAPSEEAAVRTAGLTPVPVLAAMPMLESARLHGYFTAQAGHWRYAAPPPHPETGEQLADLAGFDVDEWFARRSGPIRQMCAESVDRAIHFVHGWPPDLIVHDPLSFEGLLLGRLLDAPSYVQLWGPSGLAETATGMSLVPKDYSKAFERLGLGEVDWSSTTGVLDPSPSALPATSGRPSIPIRYVPYNGAGSDPGAELPEPTRRRVGLVWGNSTTAMIGAANSPLQAIVAGLGDVDADVVITTGNRDTLLTGATPSNVTVLTNVPMTRLLSSCDAVVHSAGGGCTMTAVTAGVPQLLVPSGVDMHLMAERVAATAAGRAIAAWDVTADAVRDAVTVLLDDPSAAFSASRLAAGAADRPTPLAVGQQLVTGLVRDVAA